MRRPRAKLEVSTFPFLAVLLCAMGSLLLLLFIMDRRAKIAAQNSTRESVAARQKRTVEEEAARQAEWEKAKELLHRTLLQKQEELLAAFGGVDSKLKETGKQIVIGQARGQEINEHIKAETDKIVILRAQIAGRRDGLNKAEKDESLSKAELAAATKELAELEQALLAMKLLREREKQIYSVVPYRGKRGDMRPPIYVECVRGGVLFHPDKTMLNSWQLRPDILRTEVERHAGPLAARTVDEVKTTSTGTRTPYVLFLIRPEGIESYYQAQGALRGYRLEFGYELVDSDWVLDLSAPIFGNEAHDRPGASNPPSALAGNMGFRPGGGGNGNGASGAGGSNGPGANPAIGSAGGSLNGPNRAQAGGVTVFPSAPSRMAQGNPAGASAFPTVSNGRGNGAGGAYTGAFAPPVPVGSGGGGGSGFASANSSGSPGPLANGYGSGLGTPPGNGPILPTRPGGVAGGSNGTGSGFPGYGTGGGSGPGIGPGTGYPASPGSVAANPPGMTPSPGNPAGVGGDPRGPAFVPIGSQGNSASTGYRGTPGATANPGAGSPSATPEMIASAGPGYASGYAGGGSNGGTRGGGTPGGGMPGDGAVGGGSGGTPGDGAVGGGSGGTSGGGGTVGGGGAPSAGYPSGQGGGSPQSNGQAGGAPTIQLGGGANGAGAAPTNSGSPANGDPNGQPSGKAAPGQFTLGGGSTQDSGAAGDGDNLLGPRLPASFAPPARKGSAPAPLGKVLGNKDFIVTIDCYADRVNVFPGATIHRWSTGNMQAADQLLVQTVTNVIARRQATVRPGEPPYHPMIRFQVTPEGLRTYYHVYPLLEHLNVPMARENKVDK